MDDTIKLLLAENSTYDWNPLIFAIFYQKQSIVEFFCEHEMVYVRNCLTTPFIIEAEEEIDDGGDEEKFIKEKTELMGLIFCIMLKNKDMFKYMWKKCAYMWNDIHLVLLTNYIFEAQWLDGMNILFASMNTHQTFNQMNLFEKEKYLKFCDKSAAKIPSMVRDFRMRMAFDPYNVFYLPILASPEELQLWDKEQTKEQFFENCQENFDERSYNIL